MRRIVRALVCIAAVGACGPTIHLEHQAPATFHTEPGGYERAEVTRVVDGDTIVVLITGRVDGPSTGAAEIGTEHSVRLVGIDTPESVDPNSDVECYGPEASSATKSLLEGRDVVLVKDLEERDGYDRLLRYVYIGDEMANARLVVNGYAHDYPYPPNVRHADLFAQLEREARESDRGLWSPGTCNGHQ
ncbi:MAG TPA: thermonuclease family protein [Actinomycetota bacterium]